MEYVITDKTLKVLKTLHDNLAKGLVSKKSAALTLKYAIEDIDKDIDTDIEAIMMAIRIEK